MTELTHQDLLEAGAHFGHLKRKWNPKMAPYIFMERGGIHIIDLNKTIVKANEAAAAIKQIAKSGKKILFVATKKQAKDIVADSLQSVKMPFVTERWPGGMLTNFVTIRKAVKKMSSIDKILSETENNINKKERLLLTREKSKLDRNFGSINDLTRLPAALFIVDITREKIAVAEAKKLNIPTFAIVDTNSDPTSVDFAIPANDDTSKSISIIMKKIVEAIEEGLAERKFDKEKMQDEKDDQLSDENLKIVPKSVEMIIDPEETAEDKAARLRKTLKKDLDSTDDKDSIDKDAKKPKKRITPGLNKKK
ncbi:MAG: 30S ribosomal protein S2 [Bacteroidetes bacterium GWE2_29_8]|nr:MAG: 30S ribosomal protein S2 [Bacteroidetes bacterium GWE2_29_8]OFY22401.1 MAG: 30S ribosomal protein S2 [Bacteroidetes bacterium GWF2_29_10]